MKKKQRNLYFTENQEFLMEEKARRLGITVNDWIKYVVTKEVEPLTEDYEIASPELEESIGRAMDDYKHGRYVTLNTPEEIDAYFDKLNKENE